MTTKVEPSRIGQRLEKLRAVAEISARELDRLAGTTEGHASLVEGGTVKNVSAETISKFARVLGASLDWLIDGEGKEPSDRVVRAAVEEARAKSSKTKPAA